MNEEIFEPEATAESELAVEATEPIETPNEPDAIAPDGETFADEPCQEAPEDEEKAGLRVRIAELERELEQRDKSSAQKKELLELFPDADPDSLPNQVKEQYESGVPLAAAYALYERIKTLELRKAEEQSRKNARLIHGELGNNAQNIYYTAEEVRAMSRDQVRMNFESILDSMRRW